MMSRIAIVSIYFAFFTCFSCTSPTEPIEIKSSDKESEESLGLPGYSLQCFTVSEESVATPKRVIGCFVGDERRRNEALKVSDIIWNIAIDKELISSIEIPTRGNRWHVLITLSAKTIDQFRVSIAELKIEATFKKEGEDQKLEVALEQEAKKDNSIIFTSHNITNLSNCEENKTIITEELLGTDFYQDYVFPRISILAGDQWLWSALGNGIDYLARMTPVESEFTNKGFEFRADSVVNLETGTPSAEPSLDEQEAWKICADSKDYQNFVNHYLVLTGPSGFPFCPGYVYGEIFDCNGFSCGKSDPGYVNICQVNDDNIPRAPSGYPYCGETYYGIEFACGDQTCAKSDPEYKNICEIEN